MIRKFIGLVLVLALAAAACGDDDGGSVSYDDPESIESCDDLLDAGFALLQDTLDEMGDLDLSALESEEPPPAFAELEQKGNALTARAEALGCDPDELDAGIAARVDDLDVDDDNILGQLILQGITAGEGGFFDE
jgi:hypothetical protein